MKEAGESAMLHTEALEDFTVEKDAPSISLYVVYKDPTFQSKH